jgi:hypothetical protein
MAAQERPVGFLLDINRWLERSGVTIRLHT